MKGKIEIIIHNSSTVTIKGDVDGLDGTGKLMIFETLRDALELDEIDRKIIGTVIYAGGIEAMGGPVAQTVRIPHEIMTVIDRMKKMKENNNETDAL